jgi:hypothetical protein
VIDPAGEGVILNRSTPSFQPSEQACSDVSSELELNRPTCFLLNDDSSCANVRARDQVADPDLHQVTPAKLAVDRQIKQRAITKPALPI